MTSYSTIRSEILRDYYGMSPALVSLREAHFDSESPEGFFRYGPELVCYGKCASGCATDIALAGRYDAANSVGVRDSLAEIPFQFSSLIHNMRMERYFGQLKQRTKDIAKYPRMRKLYYGAREFLPVALRRHLQKSYFKDWQKIPFPNWPVDFTADLLHEEFLKLAMKSNCLKQMPFIWFWPEGAKSCLILTHDVETEAGRDFSSKLMDLDQAHGFRASFQVIPEKRYQVPWKYWNEIRGRGFEFNIHDLNHDRYLFQDRSEFQRRAKLINGYAKTYDARGFRAGAMYRNQDWFSSLDFSYDMSVPNVAHLEPQRGGCCTVMPYFVGKILELPLTTSQDYSVFNILEQYSTALWEKQISLILKRNGLITMLSHPDYLIDLKPRGVYDGLLGHLRKMCDRENVWHALPGEVDQWWRARKQMKIIDTGNGWNIQGPESHRARLAFAVLDGDRLTYIIASPTPVAPDTRLTETGSPLHASSSTKKIGEDETGAKRGPAVALQHKRSGRVLH